MRPEIGQRAKILNPKEPRFKITPKSGNKDLCEAGKVARIAGFAEGAAAARAAYLLLERGPKSGEPSNHHRASKHYQREAGSFANQGTACNSHGLMSGTEALGKIRGSGGRTEGQSFARQPRVSKSQSVHKLVSEERVHIGNPTLAKAWVSPHKQNLT